MEILIVLSFIVVVSLPFLFLTGFIMMIVGAFKQRKKTIRRGFIFFSGSLLVAASLLTYKYGLGKILPQLTKTDLVGDYKLVNAADQTIHLHLDHKNIFETSGALTNSLCEQGRYKIYSDEVWFTCGSSAKVAKIHRTFLGFQLKFGSANKPSYTLEKIQR